MSTTCKLVSRQEIAESTMAFHFEKPSGWTYRPGQTLDITLPAPPETDDEGNVRTFTIAAAPHEKTLMVATRMRDTAFKRVLKTMPLGEPVEIEGPAGELTLHRDPARSAVFLAGGIGITPFRSISLDAAHTELSHTIYLFYSNRRPEDAAFLEEMQALQQQNCNFHLIATMTGMEKSRRTWDGETGKIDKAMLAKYLKNAAAPIYYVAGPPDMVAALQSMLGASGVGAADIRAEEFSGY
jgi:ferredoxin-NADP reductase